MLRTIVPSPPRKALLCTPKNQAKCGNEQNLRFFSFQAALCMGFFSFQAALCVVLGTKMRNIND